MFGKHYFAYGVWWKEPTLNKLKKLKNIEFWDDPRTYVKAFLGGDFNELKNVGVTDLPSILSIMNICLSGYRRSSDKAEKSTAMTVIEERIAKRKQRMIDKGEIEPEKTVNKSDMLWITTLLMKGDVSQDYQSIMEMNLTEIFGVFDKLKDMSEDAKKRKKKGKNGNGKDGVDLTSLNLPTLGERGEKNGK